MPFELHELRSFGNALHPLLVEARANDQRDDRWGIRYPFFRAVSITGPNGEHYDAFSRDISASGIGLLHNVELPPGLVDIHISSARGYGLQVQTRIFWCQSCGEGWYISGGRFTSVPTVDEP
ncbi:MAG TPA: PilZ domain-containing protein [Pirellulales bacterium]|nr:PilZ domain-containing protein [Pirellulales bacterium]